MSAVADTHTQQHYLEAELSCLLREQPNIFAFLERASLDGLWFWDLTAHEHEWMSEKFWETLGYDPADKPHLASAWMDIINPEDLEAAKRNLSLHLADPTYPYDQIVRYRHAQGHEVTVRCRGLAIRDEHGKPARLLGAHNDLTRERRVQRLLTDTNRAARIGSWEYNLASQSIYWSEVTREIHEITDPDFVPDLSTGVNFYKVGYSRDRILEVLTLAQETGEPWDEKLEIVTAKGAVRWVRAVGRAERHQGRTVRLYGSFQDIHEETLQAQRLAKSEALLRSNFDFAPNGMVIANANGCFVKVNTGFADLLGYEKAELIGRCFKDVTHPDDRAEDQQMMQQFSLGTVETIRREKRYLRKNGDVIWGDAALVVERDAAGKPSNFHAQIVDITAQKLAESKRHRIALLEDKAREMEQFAHIASHDLRQPVLTIKGYVTALKEDYAEQMVGDAEHYLSVIDQSLQRMDDMIRGLLDYSRLSKAKPLQAVDLDALLAGVVLDLDALIQETTATIHFASLPTIMGYPVELRQVFQNLVCNALQYRRANVTPVVEISCTPEVDGIRFAVNDNGQGINAVDQERIFGLFQRATTSPSESGTGIGLANCRTIVERHGGSIWVESSLGQGSTFYFTLSTEEVPFVSDQNF